MLPLVITVLWFIFWLFVIAALVWAVIWALAQVGVVVPARAIRLMAAAGGILALIWLLTILSGSATVPRLFAFR